MSGKLFDPEQDKKIQASLALAMQHGEGAERPCRCPSPAHEDTRASASVNIVKKVWYCYACQASGKVDSKLEPSTAELLALLDPERAARIYPASWLELFGSGYYWQTRFPAEICKRFNLGEDPFTGEATYPVYTPKGHLAGVARRTDGPQKYLYPVGWSASRSLACYPQAIQAAPAIVVLTEGYADAVAVWEAGAVGLAVYGSGLHHPQRELIARLNVKLVVMGFDSDDAGRTAAQRSTEICNDLTATVTALWSDAGAKDPAELPVQARRDVLNAAVADFTGTPAWLRAA